MGGPGNRVGSEQMTKEPGNITKTVGFVSVNGEVVVLESLLKGFIPDSVELAKTFSDETIEC